MKKKDINFKNRIFFIDELRGFCIICMVIYHAMFDLVYIFKLSSLLPIMNILNILEPFFAAVFIIICGLSCMLSKNNLIRGLKLLAVAILVSVVTIVFMPEQAIYFGILHMLAVSILLFVLLKKLLIKIPTAIGMAINIILFFLTYQIGQGKIGAFGIYLNIPESITSIKLFFPIGLHIIPSADYFPLFPWIFIFIFGVYIGVIAKKNKLPRFMYRSRIKALSVVGSHTLLIYILHQPIIYGILYLLFNYIIK
jgi:Predicted membrane protein